MTFSAVRLGRFDSGAIAQPHRNHMFSYGRRSPYATLGICGIEFGDAAL